LDVVTIARIPQGFGKVLLTWHSFIGSDQGKAMPPPSQAWLVLSLAIE